MPADNPEGDMMNVLYTATAHATGDGRNGHATSDDGILDVDLRVPKAMGGPGGATNPEQLFAAGYAACFHSALKVVAGREQLDVTGTEVSASVGIGMNDAGGFGLAVELDVAVPKLDRAAAEALVAKAHEVCPYSNATRGNIDVRLTVV
jgi:Ohr subfamily peroxiredoxin